MPGGVAADPNTAARFDGSNDYATANLNLSGTSKLTVEFWLNWTAFANDDRLAMEFTGNFNDNAGGFLVDPNDPSGKFQLSHRHGGFSSGYNTALFNRPTAGAWHSTLAHQ